MSNSILVFSTDLFRFSEGYEIYGNECVHSIGLDITVKIMSSPCSMSLKALLLAARWTECQGLAT